MRSPQADTLSLSRRTLLLGAAPALAVPLAACSFLGGGGDDAKTLKVLAGSEIRDLEPLLEEMAQEIGYGLEITYEGTLDGTDALVTSGAGDFEATWFPSNYYLSLFQESSSLLDQQNPIMSSPVVLGLRTASAQELGWTPEAPPSWPDVIAAVESGRLRFGMTSPLSSNSGFSTLLEAATALSGTGTALTASDIAATVPQLTAFSRGQALTAGSSGWLAERFMEDPDAVDGIFNYESVLAGLDVPGGLVLLAPSDGVVTADYPFTLLTGADEDTRTAYDTVTAHLRSPAVQQRIAETTRRRTSATAAGDAVLFETPYPASLATVQELLKVWFEQTRKPSQMWFQIDTSGSMEGERLERLKEALGILSGRDAQTANESLLALQPRERLTIVEFSSEIKSTHLYELAEGEDPEQARHEIDVMIAGLRATGDTAIYSTLADVLAQASDAAAENVFTSVVVFTDGENTAGTDFADFEEDYRSGRYSAGTSASGIPVFAIAFGEADVEELSSLAELTGGRVFDAGEDLTAAFREIRGYL